jgi:hypothetical protein
MQSWVFVFIGSADRLYLEKGAHLIVNTVSNFLQVAVIHINTGLILVQQVVCMLVC